MAGAYGSTAVDQGADRRPLIHIVFATTSGHTEFVVDVLGKSLTVALPDWTIESTLAERTQPQDLLKGSVLLLASSTWNTQSIEGQLNPHMLALLEDRARTLDLADMRCACVGLGDHRYFYTARAADRLQHYVESHHGRLILPTLRIVDEPYGQAATIVAWGERLSASLTGMV
jgi:flavodoxin I